MKIFSKFCGLLALQCLVLGGLGLSVLRQSSDGRTVTLEVSPQNRRDATRRNELLLVFPISSIKRDKISAEETVTHGTTVYTVLRQKGPYFEVEKASLQPPKIIKGQVVLQGFTVGESVAPENIWVQFGFERWPLKDPHQFREIRAAKVRIDPEGNGRIVQVLHDSPQWGRND